MHTTTDGALYLSGLVNGEAPEAGWSFKSSGNVDGGKAFWQKMTASEIAANSMPSSTVIKIHTSAMSFKSMKAAKNGFIAIGQNENGANTIVKLAADGSQEWATQCTDCGEFTSVATSKDGTEFAAAGHCSFDITKTDGCVAVAKKGAEFSGLDAAVSYFNAQGVKQWTKRYPTPPDSITLLSRAEQVVVYEETWSIATTLDGGFVLGCGSGTHCGDGIPEGNLRTKCDNANMELWQSLVTKISANGTLVWQRVDTQDPGEENMVVVVCMCVCTTS